MMSTILDPNTLLKASRVRDPRDIDVERIAIELGFRVRYVRMSSCDARILMTKNVKSITVHEELSRHRQRFSVAHEIGHFCLGHLAKNSAWSCEANSRIYDRHDPEIAANRYAGELLMPEFLVRPFIDNKEIDFQLLQSCSDVFRTSKEACAFRFCEIVDRPIMLVNFNTQTRKISFKRGRTFPSSLRLISHLPSHTLAEDVWKGGHSRSEETNAWHWFPDVEVDPRNYLVETAFRSGERIVIMLWWSNEQALIDLNEN